MKRKEYQMPTMKVVELKHRSQILAGSTQGDVDATMNGTFVEEEG